MQKTGHSEEDQEGSDRFVTFDAAIRQILTVPKTELKRREDEWKKRRAAKKRATSKA